MMNFAFKMMDIAFKMMDFVLKRARGGRSRASVEEAALFASL